MGVTARPHSPTGVLTYVEYAGWGVLVPVPNTVTASRAVRPEAGDNYTRRYGSLRQVAGRVIFHQNGWGGGWYPIIPNIIL